MSLEVKDIPAKITPIVLKYKRFVPVAIIVLIAFLFIFLVARINMYASIEPNEDQINEKLTKVQRPKIDANALEKIQQLQDQNIEVQSLFEQARDNPFSE